jgi:hypothetical protein
MSQKTKKQLQENLTALKTKKEQLLAAKKADEKAFTAKQQEQLDKIAEAIIDLEEQIELMEDEPAPTPTEKKQEVKATYSIPKGTEKMVHVKIIQGNRFNPKTGKEINFPVVQLFNHGEWLLFKKNFKLLGYTITEVLNDPFGDAEELVSK